VRSLLFSKVEATARDRVPPRRRMNCNLSTLIGRREQGKVPHTLRIAVTTDISRRDTLAWTATVVVSVQCGNQFGMCHGKIAFDLRIVCETQPENNRPKRADQHTWPAPIPASIIYTTRTALDVPGRTVDRQPQAMDQTANPRCIIVYILIRTDKRDNTTWVLTL
jgi:hypothetical protein